MLYNTIDKKLKIILLFIFYINLILLLFIPHIYFLSANYMVFTLGILTLCIYIFFSNKLVISHITIGYTFLLSILFYPTGGNIYLAVCFFIEILFCLSIRKIQISKLYKILVILISIVSVILVFIEQKPLIFVVVGLYLTIYVFSSKITRKNKIDVLVVDILFLTGVFGCLWKLDISIGNIIRESMVFTFPVSIIIYILIVNKREIANKIMFILKPNILFFIYMNLAFLTVIITSKFFYKDDSYKIYSLVLILLLLWVIYKVYIDQKIDKNILYIKETLDNWFKEKWEICINDQETNFSWVGFESRLGEVLSNDGIRICYKEKEIFSSGVFIDNNFEHQKKIIEGDTIIYINEKANHRAFSIQEMYVLFSLVKYINSKMLCWESIKELKIATGSGDYSKEIQFRKDVTYYLHDNVLQNIIATKNIISTIKTNQSALKDLAVETLTELNDSIRSQMHEIYPSTLKDLSFEQNIHILIDDLNKKFGKLPSIHINYSIFEKLDEEYTYYFYRAILELLTNTCKHADAKNVWINMESKSCFILEVCDDGEFLSNKDNIKIKHLGLSSLRHQALSFKGDFRVIEEDNKKIFRITLPRRENENTFI